MNCFIITGSKLLCRSDGLLFFGKLVVEFLSTSPLLISKSKFSYHYSESHLFLTWLVITSNSVFELLTVPCTHVVLVSRMIISRKKDTLACTAVEYGYLKALAKTFTVPVRQNFTSNKTLLTKLKFVKLPLPTKETLNSLELLLKNHSGNDNSISDRSNNSEGLSKF